MRSITVARCITIIMMVVFLSVGLGVLLNIPCGWDASAAYTDTTEPAHGLVDVVPHFAGLEVGFSSESIHFVNEYGDCGWEVNECWLTTFIGGVGLWEAGNSYRAGAASLEPVLAQDGVPLLVQDVTAAQYLALFHDVVDANYDASTGSHRFFMTGVGNGLQVHAAGIAPGANALRVDILHTGGGGEGVVRSLTGDLQLDAVGDVYTLDNFGINTAAPSEALHVTGGNIRMVDGNEGVGTIMTDDGTGTGVATWASFASITGGVFFLYDTASTDVAGYDTLFPDPSVGGVQSYVIAVPASPTLIEEFVTEIGEPGITFIDDGLIEFHFDARRSAGTRDIRVYAEIYTRTHPGAVETLIATTEESNILTNAQASYEIHAIVPFTTMTASDRLVVKAYANQYAPGAAPTVQFYVEGTTNTRIELPGADTGSAISHTTSAVIVKGADPTAVTIETGVGEAAEDFFVYVTCVELNGDRTWPAFGNPLPVADFVTFYWAIEAGDLVAYISNDSQLDIQAIIWFTR